MAIDDGEFFARIEAAPDRAHGLIRHYGDAIGFRFVLPPTGFDDVWELFRIALGGSGMAFSFKVEFFGFKSEAADSTVATPTIKEFLSGNPYFVKMTRFSVSRIPPDLFN